MARENRSWGYTRIQGALGNLGPEVGRSTIAKVLKEAGQEPAPDRHKQTTWKEFLRSHFAVLAAADFLGVGIRSLRLPVRSPNLNAYAERYVRTIKERCLGPMILIGEGSLHLAIKEFVVHYHAERNHQSLKNRIIRPEFAAFPSAGEIHRRKRLGGMLRYCYRQAS